MTNTDILFCKIPASSDLIEHGKSRFSIQIIASSKCTIAKYKSCSNSPLLSFSRSSLSCPRSSRCIGEVYRTLRLPYSHRSTSVSPARHCLCLSRLRSASAVQCRRFVAGQSYRNPSTDYGSIGQICVFYESASSTSHQAFTGTGAKGKDAIIVVQ